MEWIYTGALFVAGGILFIIFSIYRGIKDNKTITEVLNCLAEQNNMKLSIVSKKEYNYLLEDDDVKIYLNVIKIPSNSSVTINSRNTWCLRWGGKRMGRSYPNMRYMNELVPFLKTDYFDDKKVVKVVVLYPNTEVILKYLNESELATVTVSDLSYGMKVIRFSDLEDDFLNLKNGKDKK